MKPISLFIRVLSSGKDENIKKIERNLGETGGTRWRGWNQIWTRDGTTGPSPGSMEKFLGLPMKFVQWIGVGEGAFSNITEAFAMVQAKKLAVDTAHGTNRC